MQFTPDSVPSDITGFTVYNKESGSFEYMEGCAMTNLLLADEINRTSSKTQIGIVGSNGRKKKSQWTESQEKQVIHLL